MAYGTNQQILRVLGPFVDTTDDLTAAEVDAYQAVVDGWIRDKLGAVYSPFNQVTESPATPKGIQQISRHWSTAESLRQLVGVNNVAAADLADRHQTIADTLLQGVMDSPERALAPELKSGEALTFGDATPSWTLQSHESYIAGTSPILANSGAHPPNVLKSTVRITAGTHATWSTADLLAMRMGREFTVFYSPEYRQWVFSASESGLHNGDTTGLQITYEWDYRRVTGTEDVAGSGGAILVSQF